MAETKTSRNSILEILRLCASLWVMYYHGLSLFTRTEAFRNGRIAVDFFFLLSGFFFLASFKKDADKPFFKGLLSFVWKRFKPLMATFLVCFVFSVIYYIQFFEGFFETSIWGYLWYVPHLMLVFAVYFVLRKLIKNNLAFNIVTFAIVAMCFSLILTYTTNYGVWRGFAGVGLGILISQLPQIWQYKPGKIVSCLLTPLLFAAITIMAILHPETTLQDCLCLLVLFPAIVYFASQIPFSNKYVNLVCSLSFGLYTYQAVIRVFEANGIITIGWQQFLIVLALAVIDKACHIFVKHLKNKKSLKNN